MTTSLPWRAPRHELLLLCLVAAAALQPVYSMNAQDQSRICLSTAFAHGHVSNDRCLAGSFDRALYRGHFYSDKAPGMSLFEVPAVEAVLNTSVSDAPTYSLRLWLIRLLASGIAYVACAFAVGRIGEGLAPGFGAPTLVAFALGTLVAPFAAANFSHVPVAALGFGAFAFAWARRPRLAGLLAGIAVLCEYQAIAQLLIVGAYVALRSRRALLAYAVGVLPGIALLAVYDTLAFGAPWHASYRYIENPFAGLQATGFFGIGSPHVFGAYMVFSGNGGLLVLSPVLLVAAWGLVLVARRYPWESLVCAAVVVFYVLLNCGYFLPYGGVSPGPRFLVPALPFLAVGLAPAFARRPFLCSLLTLLSVVPTIALMLAWPANNPLRNTVWGALVRAVEQGGSSKYVRSLTPTVLHWVGAGRALSALAVAVAAAAAFAVAIGSIPWRTMPRRTATRWSGVLVVASLSLVAAADASAIAAYPYGDRTTGQANIVDLKPTIQGSKTVAQVGDEVDFTVWVQNPTEAFVDAVVLEVRLPPGMRLLGAPYYERGPGCVGTTTISCNLGFLESEMSTLIRFGVRVTQIPPAQTVKTTVTSEGVPAYSSASFTVKPIEPGG